MEKQKGLCNSTAEILMQAFAEREHLVFWCSFPLSRGALRSEGGERESIHIRAETKSADTVMTIVAVNPLTIHRAVAKWCNGKK